MTDLKQISDEIAKAIFDRIEQDKTLILSNVAEVIHKELAVRVQARENPSPAMHSTYEQIKEIIHNMDTKPRELGNVFTESNPWWYYRQHKEKAFKNYMNTIGI